jgi:hypothetical protein
MTVAGLYRKHGISDALAAVGREGKIWQSTYEKLHALSGARFASG